MQISLRDINQAEPVPEIVGSPSASHGARVRIERRNLLETCDKSAALISIQDSNNALPVSSAKRLPSAPARPQSNHFPGAHELSQRMSPRSSLYPAAPSRTSICGARFLSIGGLILLLLMLIKPAASLKPAPHEPLPARVINEPGSAEAGALMEEQKSNLNDDSPLVQTKANTFFKGIRLKSYNMNDRRKGNVIAFLGIRYANAPVRRLRFMPPTDYHYAPGLVHQAQKLGPICWQRWPIDYRSVATNGRQGNDDDRLDNWLELTKTVMPQAHFAKRRHLFRQLASMEQSEDCLNLNIYAPEEDFLARNNDGHLAAPVLVIIHGDSFDYGAGSALNPARLVERNRIIVITFNYRLNILGFPPKLAAGSRTNLGLLDQVAALLWIRDNAAAFGGSAHNITLMGSKEGAVFVNLLMLSPLAKGLFRRAVMEDGSALTPLLPTGNLNQPAARSLPMMQHIRLLGQLSHCAPSQRRRANASAAFEGSAAGGVALAPEVGASSSAVAAAASADDTQVGPRWGANLLECLRQLPVEQLLSPIPVDLLQPAARADSSPLIQRRWLQVTGSVPEADEAKELVPVTSELLRQLLERAATQQLDKPRGSRPDELFGAIYLQPSMSVLFGPHLDGIAISGDFDAVGGSGKNFSSLVQHKDLLVGVTKPILVDSADGEDVNRSSSSRSLSLGEWVPFQLQNWGLSSEEALSLVNKFVRIHYRWHNQEIANSIVAQYLNQANLFVQFADNSALDGPLNNQQMLLGALSEAFHDATVNVPILKVSLLHSIRQLEPLAQELSRRLVEELTQQPVKSRNLAKINFLDKFQAFVEASLERQSLTASGPNTRHFRATYLYQIDTQPWIRHIHQQIEKLTRFREPVWQAIRFRLVNLVKRLAKEDLQSQISLGCSLYAQHESEASQYDLYLAFKDWLCSRLGTVLSSFVAANEDGQAAEEQEKVSSFNERLDYFSSTCNEELNPLGNPLVDYRSTQAASSSSSNTSLALTCESVLVTLALEHLQDSLSPGQDWRPFEPTTQYVATLPAPARNLVQINHISANQDHKTSILSRVSFWTNNIPTYNCSKTQVIQPNLVLGTSKSFNASALLNSNAIFSCQSGPLTYLDLLKRVATGIKQEVAHSLDQIELRKKLDSVAKSTVAPSANIMNLTDADPQQVTNSANQAIADSMASDNSPVLTQAVSNDVDDPSKAIHYRTKYAGSVLLVCAILLILSLVSASRAIKNQRKRQATVEKARKEGAVNEKETALTETNLSKKTSEDGEMSPRETVNRVSLESTIEHPQEVVQESSDNTYHLEPCFFDDQHEMLSSLPHLHAAHLIVEPISQPMVVYDNHTSLCSSMASEQSKSVKLTADHENQILHHHHHHHNHAETILNSLGSVGEMSEIPMFNGYHTCRVGLQEGVSNVQNPVSKCSSLKKKVKISDSVGTMRPVKGQKRPEQSSSLNLVNDMIYCPAHTNGLLSQQENYCQHGRSGSQIHIWPVDEANTGQLQMTDFYSNALPVNRQGEQISTYRPDLITSIIPIEDHSKVDKRF